MVVADDDEIMLITQHGMMLRTDLEAVREIGRATQGVRLIRLKEGDKLVACAKIAREETDEASRNGAEAPDSEAPQPSPPPTGREEDTEGFADGQDAS